MGGEAQLGLDRASPCSSMFRDSGALPGVAAAQRSSFQRGSDSQPLQLTQFASAPAQPQDRQTSTELAAGSAGYQADMARRSQMNYCPADFLSADASLGQEAEQKALEATRTSTEGFGSHLVDMTDRGNADSSL